MTDQHQTGTLHVVGMGPGDPELLTLKAVRRLHESPVIAYFAKRGRQGHARRIAHPHIPASAQELRFEYPYTTEITVNDPRYEPALTGFYEDSAATIENHLAAGQDVALLCEGDPFFYGSAMYLFDRLRARFATSVTPGISAMSGCWSSAQVPMTHGDDILTVLPGTMDEAAMTGRLQQADAAVIMKVGTNLPKIRRAIESAGLTGRATLVEHGTMASERLTPLAVAPEAAPYFSLVIIPGRQRPR